MSGSADGYGRRSAAIALWNAIDSIVLAFGRIVVCVVAAAEVRTIKISSRLKTVPTVELPKIELPSTDSTSP